ncbi:MAG: alpha-amylase/4-alpha-glucanotransferase domain-containing protein, partial [Chloroflexota bacterium]
TGTRTIHAELRLKDPNVARLLSYDRYPRFSLIDHFLSPDIGLGQFAACDYEELGDFADRPYECAVEALGQKMSISLRRQAGLRLQGRALPFMVRKVLLLEAGQEVLEVQYRVKNASHLPASGVFGIEWNINLLGGGHNDQAYYEVPGKKLDDAHLDSTGGLPQVSTIIMGNRHLGIRLELSLQPAAEVWRFPVETVSNSEDGIEGLYQASCLLIRVPFNLEPQRETGVTLTWSQR